MTTVTHIVTRTQGPPGPPGPAGSVTVATNTTVANLSAVTVAALGGGYTPVAGDTVLIYGLASPDGIVPASAAYAGHYTVGTVTVGVAPLTRSALFNTASEIGGAMWYVQKGTDSNATLGCPMRPADITLNTTALSIEPVLGAAGGGGDLMADGTVPLTAPWPVGGYALTGVGGVQIGTTTANTSSIAFATNPNGSGRATITVADETVTGNYGTDLFLQSGKGAPASSPYPGYPGGGAFLLAHDGGAGTAGLASGWGGLTQIAGGNAGAANGGTGQYGGGVSLVGGHGTGTGVGGNIEMVAGNGGNVGAYRGYTYIDGGSSGLTNAAGDVRIGTTLASSIYVGHALATTIGITATTIGITATSINLTATNTTVTGKLLFSEVQGNTAGANGDLIHRGAFSYKNLPIGAVPGAALIINPAGTLPMWSTEVSTSLAAVRADNVLAVTTPVSYPYTTLSTDTHIRVDSSSPRSIVLHDGSTSIAIVVEDGGDLSASNNITVSLANSAKKLNGGVNGTCVVAVNGAVRSFVRDASGNWRGGV